MKKIGVFFVLVSFLLTGCMGNNYAQIPPKTPFISSVNLKDGTISFINGHSMEVFAEWEIDELFTGALLLPDQDHIAIYGKKMTTVQIYSLSKGKLVDEWEIGNGIVSIELINDSKELALIDQNADAIHVFSIDGTKLRTKKVGKNPISLYEDEATQRLYVVNFNDGKVSVLNSHSLELVDEIQINPFSTSIIVRSKEEQLWVGGHGEGEVVEENVHIYSLQTGELLESLRAPNMPIKLLSDHNQVFIVSHGSNKLYKFDVMKNDMQSLEVGINPFEIEKFQDYIVVAAYDSNEIYLIQPENFTKKNKIKVGSGPFQIIVRE